jgi:hypothetical protein
VYEKINFLFFPIKISLCHIRKFLFIYRKSEDEEEEKIQQEDKKRNIKRRKEKSQVVT